MSGPTACSVDVRHECQKSSRCQPSWGLLGCAVLYRLRTVEERVKYCKESSCCYVCGSGDLSPAEEKDSKHKRCDYRNPVDRFHLKCTAWRSKDANGRKLYCFYGAALCQEHQKISNTSTKLLDWLKEKRVKHELFTIATKSSKVPKKCKDELMSDEEAMDLLKREMKNSEFENGEVKDLPKGENMFMFFLSKVNQVLTLSRSLQILGLIGGLREILLPRSWSVFKPTRARFLSMLREEKLSTPLVNGQQLFPLQMGATKVSEVSQ